MTHGAAVPSHDTPHDTPNAARVFPLDTDFQKMARRPGGMPREDALAQAKAQLDALKSEIDDWLGRQLDALVRALAALHAPTPAADACEQVRHLCGALHDVGGSMGYALLSVIAGSLDQALAGTATATPLHRAIAACHRDALLLAYSETHRTLLPEDVSAMVLGLRRIAALAQADAGENAVRLL